MIIVIFLVAGIAFGIWFYYDSQSEGLYLRLINYGFSNNLEIREYDILKVDFIKISVFTTR
jgi:hypothetical protein